MPTNLPDLLDKPLKQFPSILSNLFYNPWRNLLEEDFPKQFTDSGIRIYEENNQLHVEAPLPGLNAKDIEVSLNKGVLFIRGCAQEETKNAKRKEYISSKRSFSYSFALPADIDERQEIQAVYNDGILHATLQLEQPASAKKIQVKTVK